MTSHLFAILSEQNRLNIIELLSKNPRSVNEIAGMLKLHQPQTSKHLRVLADAGIVEVTPIANQRMYHLRPEGFKDIDTWLEKYRYLWNERLLRLEKVLQKGGGKNV